MSHVPVLLHESLEGLAIQKGGTYVDCTTNRAGHAYEIAKTIGKKGTLVCIDLDQDALVQAQEKIGKLKSGPTVHYVHSNFRHIRAILRDLGIDKADGVLADLGLSSEELDSSKRGFSFRYDEPLLMTFNAHPSEEETTAYDIVNSWTQSSIADVLYGFADETYSRRIAHRIIEARAKGEIKTTYQLVDIVASAVPAAYRHRKTHFATKTFQALRMAVNDELGSINDLIASLPDVLRIGGRACIITFHSTEDRIVKQGIRNLSESLKLVSKKAILPQEEEVEVNPRARSAQLRIAERI
jgi:16S rRNA (cytosine1402-N4)-methyltransferase